MSDNSKDTPGTSHIIYPSKIPSSNNDGDSTKNSDGIASSETEKRLWLGNLDPKVTE